MKLLFVTNSSFTVGGTAAMLRVETDGTMLYVTLGKIPRATVSGGFDVECAYNGEEKTLSSGNFESKTAVFEYSDYVREISLCGEELSYNGTLNSVLNFGWADGALDVTPDVQVDFVGLRYNQKYKFTFDYGETDGYETSLIAMYANTKRDSDGKWFRLTLSEGKQSGNEVTGSISSIFDDRSKVEFILYFACYKADSDGIEDYVGLYEYVSPVYTISEQGLPYAPYDLNYEAVDGGVRIFWKTVRDSEFPYAVSEVQKSTGGEFYALYTGAGNECVDTGASIPGTVYRVRAKSGSNLSPWVEKEESASAVPAKCNVFIGIGGSPIAAAAIYVGIGGKPTLAGGNITVG